MSGCRGNVISHLVQGWNHLWGSSWQFLDPCLLCRYHEQGGVTCLCWILEELVATEYLYRYQRPTVRYFHRFVGSSLLLYTMNQYSRTWQNSGNWSLEDWSKYSGYCKTCYSHRTGINFTCSLDPRLAELYYCKHSGHVVLLHICRYKDYKLKEVQICHFLDSLPATGMSKDSF